MTAIQAARWSPYQDNGGSALAVAGPDYAVFAADTRLSRGYSILSRNVSKYTQLTDKCCVVSCGMRADIETLHKNLKAQIVNYQYAHRKTPTLEALSQLLSTMLYGRRFFPYYAFNMLVGVNGKGQGVVYSYDAVGNTEPKLYGTTGSASAMILPVLDSRLKPSNQTMPPEWPNREEILTLAKDALTSAAERDILTGDSADIVVVDKDGIHVSNCQLRQD